MTQVLAPTAYKNKTRQAQLSECIVRVALCGQPNVGKSTLFNLLTGLNQHVGNWPGKTVEVKEGEFAYHTETYRLVDLPGTYSLTANSAEEVVTREYIIRERPEVVLALVDASALERSLYLVTELICLPSPVIIVLNMIDVAQREGVEIKPEVLQETIGAPVVSMIATRNVGVDNLLRVIHQLVGGEIAYNIQKPQVRADHRELLEKTQDLLRGYTPDPYPIDWVALKLLEGDQEITGLVKENLPEERWEAIDALLCAHDDALVAVASGRYEWIGQVVRTAVSQPKAGQIGMTERLDRWAAHPFWGIWILAGILGLAFALTYSIGTPLQNLLDTYVLGSISSLARAILAPFPAWISGLVVDGMIGGAGSVLTFLPILAIFFAIMGVLEDVGYMARAAYVMDNFMHKMGLHGKSFLPLFVGFGCNVPAVLGTRVIESRQARLLTLLLAPLIPCTARMAVVAFLAPAFFGPGAALVSWSLVFLALLVLALSGILLNRVLFRGQRAAFIMELPLYHIPNWRTIGMQVWQRSRQFIYKAGTLILFVSLVVWALSMLPDGNVETSFLAGIGRLFEPIGQLMGFDWRLVVALLTGFIAKENSIATLGVLYGTSGEANLAATLNAVYPASAALAFLAVQMLFIPCVATVAVIRQETGSWRWTLFTLGFLLAVSLTIGILIYWTARGAGL